MRNKKNQHLTIMKLISILGSKFTFLLKKSKSLHTLLFVATLSIIGVKEETLQPVLQIKCPGY